MGEVDLGHAPGTQAFDDAVAVVYELFQLRAL
jgi:hypothetical protein